MERTATAEPSSALQQAAPTLEESLPVLDPAPLTILADDAGNAVEQRIFAEYLDLLPSRVSKVIGCLTGNDAAASRDALVSLKVTSAMAGAVRMEQYCPQLEARLAVRKLPDPAAVLVTMSKTSRLILQDKREAWPDHMPLAAFLPPDEVSLAARPSSRHYPTTPSRRSRWL